MSEKPTQTSAPTGRLQESRAEALGAPRAALGEVGEMDPDTERAVAWVRAVPVPCFALLAGRGGVAVANQAFADEHAGGDVTDLAALDLDARVHPEDRARLGELAGALAGGAPHASREVRLRTGRAYAYYRVDVTRPGAVTGVATLATVQNSDAASRGRQRLTRATRQLELLESSAQFGMFDWDMEGGEEVEWTDGHYRVLGYEPGEIDSRADEFFALVHPGDVEALKEAIGIAIETGEKFAREFRVRHKSGEYVSVLSEGRTHVDTRGRRRLVGMINSVEGRRRAQLDAEQVRAQLREFVYAVSHDLRAPVRHVQSFIAMLREALVDHPDADVASMLGLAGESARKLGEMIDGLLDYSRVEEFVSEARLLDLNAVVDRVLRRLSDRHGEPLAVEKPAGALPRVYASGDLLESVLFILLDNAFKYSRSAAGGGRVGVRFEADHALGPALFVRDNGVGFDERHAAKLFGMFERLHSQSSYAGIGMGLAIARRSVERRGGKIWAWSEVNKGAEFGITIPELRPVDA